MALWIAKNGYVGYGPVGAIVEAEDEASARVAAVAAFKSAAIEGGEDADWYSRIRSIEELTLPYVGDTL